MPGQNDSSAPLPCVMGVYGISYGAPIKPMLLILGSKQSDTIQLFAGRSLQKLDKLVQYFMTR